MSIFFLEFEQTGKQIAQKKSQGMQEEDGDQQTESGFEDGCFFSRKNVVNNEHDGKHGEEWGVGIYFFYPPMKIMIQQDPKQDRQNHNFKGVY